MRQVVYLIIEPREQPPVSRRSKMVFLVARAPLGDHLTSRAPKSRAESAIISAGFRELAAMLVNGRKGWFVKRSHAAKAAVVLAFAVVVPALSLESSVVERSVVVREHAGWNADCSAIPPPPLLLITRCADAPCAARRANSSMSIGEGCALMRYARQIRRYGASVSSRRVSFCAGPACREPLGARVAHALHHLPTVVRFPSVRSP